LRGTPLSGNKDASRRTLLRLEAPCPSRQPRRCTKCKIDLNFLSPRRCEFTFDSRLESRSGTSISAKLTQSRSESRSRVALYRRNAEPCPCSWHKINRVNHTDSARFALQRPSSRLHVQFVVVRVILGVERIETRAGVDMFGLKPRCTVYSSNESEQLLPIPSRNQKKDGDKKRKLSLVPR
jgi:hypothetical protein